MCGIAGIVSPDSRRYESSLHVMVQQLLHRGPDDSGTYLHQDCILGHTRLSIIDLTSGKQPMHSAISQKTIVFNGEIYGYREIRKQLKDYPFATSSDTEVILALYESKGKDCLDQLPGMFAFAIWDDAEKTLFAARDRFGEKPFYYAWGTSGEFIFASEIKAILASGLVNPILDRCAVQHYLKYLYVHPQATIYENIHTLPPAHYLILKNGRLIIQRYWSFPQPAGEISVDEAVEQFKRLFEKAVRNQLVADVPVGAFLSGGLDSSTVVAVASRQTSHLQTFSFGFENNIDELPFARQIAVIYQTDHHELTASDVDIGDLLLKMAEVYDEPFADSSNIPTYLLAQLAREHTKVILTGDGGDELLGGYEWYRPLLGIGLKKTSSWYKEWMLGTLTKIFVQNRGSWKSQLSESLITALNAYRYTHVINAYDNRYTYFSPREIDEMLLESYSCTSKESTSRTWSETGTINDAMRMDMENYLPGDILVKIDRASMAHGLELRAPFLDVEFASFCISLPYYLKITKAEDKIILRRAYEYAWSEEIRKRGKQGFGAPVSVWLKQNHVRQLKKEFLCDPKKRIFSLISYAKTRKYVDQDSYKTWILLVLAIWMDRHPCEISGMRK